MSIWLFRFSIVAAIGIGQASDVEGDLMTVNDGDILRVQVNMSFDNVDKQMHTFHYQYQGSVSQDDDNIIGAIELTLREAYEDLEAFLSDGWRAHYLGFYNVTQDVPMPDEAFATTIQGTQTGTTLPLQACALAIFRTGTKRSVGKKFISCVMSVDTTDGQTLNATVKSGIQVWADAVLTSIDIPDGSLSPGNWNEDLVRFTPWISYLVRPGIYTQRRRRLGQGI